MDMETGRGPRVLVVAPQPFFTPRGTPFSVYYRTLVLAEQGASIDLLTYGQGLDVELPATRIVRLPPMPFLGAIPIGPSWRKLFLDLLLIVWTTGMLLRRRYAFVDAHEEAVFWCRPLRLLFGFRLVYDMHSSLPQQLGNFGFTKSRWLIGAFRRLEDWCLRGADAVITICPDLRDYALSSGVPPERHLLIENSIFEDVRLRAVMQGQIADVCLDAALQQLDPRHPVVLYAGTFESYQGLDILVQAFARVRQDVPDAQLLMVGGTPAQVAALQRTADAAGVPCLFTGRVSKSGARRCIERADVLVSPRSHGTNTPLKIYEQLASGKALVATRIWSHTQVLDDDVCILVDAEPASMAQGIVRALRDPTLREALGQRARQLYAAKYARPAYEAKIRRLLEMVA